MKVRTLLYRRDSGWTAPLPQELDSPSTLVLLFGAREMEEAPAALRDLRKAFPRSHLLGCSTAGEILGTKVSDGTAAVAVVRFERSFLRSTCARTTSGADSRAAGETLARELDDPALRSVFVLSNGLDVNGSELVRGLSAVLGDRVTVTGGLAGDGARFERTWVAKDDVFGGGLVAAVGIYGEHVRTTHGSKGGWDIFGPERVVTRSEGNVLYTLDGRPALELYKEYLGERAAGLPATALLFPLAVRASHSDPKQLVRTVLAVDEAAQSMTFAGDIPQGAFAQLMRANFEGLIQGASDAATLATSAAEGESLAIAISCIGRRLVLGERIEEETEATAEVLSSSCHQVGFYSYGEISPYTDGSCDLHNQTMTLTILGES